MLKFLIYFYYYSTYYLSQSHYPHRKIVLQIHVMVRIANLDFLNVHG